MSLESALKALYARVPLGMRLGLEPMRAACMHAGHPENAFDTVHIAGTNGKGSTCAMVESIARASGRRTGMYTSPHLCRFAERIRIDGEPIDDAMLTRVLEEALRVGHDLSFFETATLAAFLAFREAKVDLAVIEVGIGGRLDATNVLPAARCKCTAIASVGFDHMDKLGDTLDAIAREKASIAKPGVPMVLGSMPDEARRAALDVASHARIVIADPIPDTAVVGLHGAHQRANASVASVVARGAGATEEAIAAGLANARWPGRFERIDCTLENELTGPWILDGAHNVDGLVALASALRELNEPIGAVVFGALADKAWREMLEVVVKEIDAERVYVEPPGREPISVSALNSKSIGRRANSIEDGLRKARSVATQFVHQSAPVVVCGSLYLVGTVRAKLLHLPIDPIVAL